MEHDTFGRFFGSPLYEQFVAEEFKRREVEATVVPLPAPTPTTPALNVSTPTTARAAESAADTFVPITPLHALLTELSPRKAAPPQPSHPPLIAPSSPGATANAGAGATEELVAVLPAHSLSRTVF